MVTSSSDTVQHKKAHTRREKLAAEQIDIACNPAFKRHDTRAEKKCPGKARHPVHVQTLTKLSRRGQTLKPRSKHSKPCRTPQPRSKHSRPCHKEARTPKHVPALATLHRRGANNPTGEETRPSDTQGSASSLVQKLTTVTRKDTTLKKMEAGR